MFGTSYFGASYFGPTYFGPDGVTSGGTTKDWRYKFKKEDLKALEQYGLVRDGKLLKEDIPKVEEVLEIESLEEYSLSLSELAYLDAPGLDGIKQETEEISIFSEEVESIELETEDDIGLILAIIELHTGG